MSSVKRGSGEPNGSVFLLSKVVKFFRTGFAEGILILILLAFFVILSFTSPSFLTLNNLSNLVRQVAIIGVVAIGMTIVIISAGIDLSVGSVVGFSNVLVAVLMTHAVPILPSILIALAAGAALGVLNPASVRPSAWLMVFALPGICRTDRTATIAASSWARPKLPFASPRAATSLDHAAHPAENAWSLCLRIINLIDCLDRPENRG